MAYLKLISFWMDNLIATVEIIIISHGDQNSNWSKITEYQVLWCLIRLPWVWAPPVQILIQKFCKQNHFSKKIPTKRIARSHFFQLCSAWCAGNIAKIQQIDKRAQQNTNITRRFLHWDGYYAGCIFKWHPKNYPVSALSIVNLYFYN